MGLIDTLFGQRTFFLRNEDSGKELQGQFQAENVSKNVGANYSTSSALNMQTPIRQFINGEVDTVTFQATFFNRDEFFGGAEDDLELLESWVRRDSEKGRPPILSFSVGDGHLSMVSCVMEKLSQTLMPPTFTGRLHGVVCDITLTKYQGYSLEGPAPGETRYHRAKDRDYYEMLTWNEYGSAEMGDIIRKRHPDKPNLQIADIVKLPSVEAIRTERIEQKSNVLKTAYGKKDTPQRALRLSTFESRNRTYVSHII